MGLDMYLYKRKYISKGKRINITQENPVGEYDNGNTLITMRTEYKDGTNDTQIMSVNSDTFMGVTIETPVGYWRKANAIHRWFVENCADGVDDCRPVRVQWYQLKELRELCEKVLAEPEKAEELLPTQDGFFFGATTYDDFYLNDLQETVEMLKELDEHCEYVYEASW